MSDRSTAIHEGTHVEQHDGYPRTPGGCSQLLLPPIRPRLSQAAISTTGPVPPLQVCPASSHQFATPRPLTSNCSHAVAEDLADGAGPAAADVRERGV
jgi:hypothetical protein